MGELVLVGETRMRRRVNVLTSVGGAVDRSLLADQAYEAIRKEILNGSYPPGAWLRIEPLAQKLGVSIVPVREALTRLVGDGLLEKFPHVGFRVKVFTKEEIVEVYELRCALEKYAAGLAARRILPEEIRALEELHKAMVSLAQSRNGLVKFHEYNQEFHSRLIRAAKNKYLEKIALEIALKVEFLVGRAAHIPGRIQQALGEHQAILEAVKEGNVDQSQVLMEEHLIRALEDLLSWWEEQRGDSGGE